LRTHLSRVEFALGRSTERAERHKVGTPRPRNGQLFRAVAATLQKAVEPLSEWEIATRVGPDRSVDVTDMKALKKFANNIHGARARRKDGMLAGNRPRWRGDVAGLWAGFATRLRTCLS